MQIYNTLTGKKEKFVPLQEGKIGMYVCGPTVYDYDHIGHARTYLSFDLLYRYLKYQGYQVNYVQNITDVGHMVNDGESGVDKIKQKAQETDQTIGQIVRHYTESHLKDMDSLNIVRPSTQPLASEHIEEIIDFIKKLVEKGYAYATKDGNVYFKVVKKEDYGKLSHRGLTEILTGTRVEPAKDKHNAADFALWKSAPFGADEYIWDSPWGRGFPGWHIECSVMTKKYLGDTFDIHGSAIDNIFPHHENEIAQTEALTGKPMAHYWLHSGMLTVNSSKMSKSLHNTVTVSEALKDYSANEIRLALYQTHWRKPFDYTKAAMEQGITLRRKLFTAYYELPKETDHEIWDEMIEALDDDLDTPRLLRIWSEDYKKINQTDTKKLFEILGLKFRDIESVPEALELKRDREKAREEKDFLTADNRKNELNQIGFEAIDLPEGSRYISR